MNINVVEYLLQFYKGISEKLRSYLSNYHELDKAKQDCMGELDILSEEYDITKGEFDELLRKAKEDNKSYIQNRFNNYFIDFTDRVGKVKSKLEEIEKAQNSILLRNPELYVSEEEFNKSVVIISKAHDLGKINDEELEKAKKDITKLRRKVITDKRGHKKTVYVKMEDFGAKKKERKSESIEIVTKDVKSGAIFEDPKNKRKVHVKDVKDGIVYAYETGVFQGKHDPMPIEKFLKWLNINRSVNIKTDIKEEKEVTTVKEDKLKKFDEEAFKQDLSVVKDEDITEAIKRAGFVTALSSDISRVDISKWLSPMAKEKIHTELKKVVSENVKKLKEKSKEAFYPKGFDEKNSTLLVVGEFTDQNVKTAFRKAGAKVKVVDDVGYITTDKGTVKWDFNLDFPSKEMKGVGLDVTVNHLGDVVVKKKEIKKSETDEDPLSKLAGKRFEGSDDEIFDFVKKAREKKYKDKEIKDWLSNKFGNATDEDIKYWMD